jgi:hypothetical protein
MPLPFAHAGHWAVDLLTLAPVLVLALWFLITGVRSRRRIRSEAETAAAGAAPDSDETPG